MSPRRGRKDVGKAADWHILQELGGTTRGPAGGEPGSLDGWGGPALDVGTTSAKSHRSPQDGMKQGLPSAGRRNSRRIGHAASFAAVLALLLSGCTSQDAESPLQEESPRTITDPTDYSYVVNQTDGSGWHVHDYWGGADRLIVLHENRSFHNLCQGCRDGMELARFRLPAGSIVPQGTAYVNVTMTWQAEIQRGFGAPELLVKTAMDAEPQSMGPIENGQTIRINATNDANDPPHQSLSLWRFGLLMPTEEDEVEFKGTLEARAVAHRGREIPAFPPHPDLWQGQEELPLFSGDGLVGLAVRDDNSMMCYGGCPGYFVPDDGALVPFNAAAVEVVLTYVAGLPAGLNLAYHGADAWDAAAAQRQPPDPTKPNQVRWLLPVDYKSGDSPYAKQSLWEFSLYMDQPTPTKVYSGAYTIEAKALREAPAS